METTTSQNNNSIGYWGEGGWGNNRTALAGRILPTKYFKQEPMQRKFYFSGVLYFGWPNQLSSGTMRVYIGLLLCTYIYSKGMLTYYWKKCDKTWQLQQT